MVVENGFQGLVDHGQDILGGEDLVLLAIQFDFGPAILGHKHAISLLHFERNFLSVVASFAGAECDNEALHWLLFG